jgi:hypothetical protein
MGNLAGQGQAIKPVSCPWSSADLNVPATNTNAVLTYASAGVGLSNVVAQLNWSYNGTPTGGRVTVSDNGVTVFDHDITAAGTGYYIFEVPKKGATNSALVITLYAGGSGVQGKLSANVWTEPS